MLEFARLFNTADTAGRDTPANLAICCIVTGF